VECWLLSYETRSIEFIRHMINQLQHHSLEVTDILWKIILTWTYLHNVTLKSTQICWLDVLNKRVTTYVYSVTFILKRSVLLLLYAYVLTQVHLPMQLLPRIGRFKVLFPILNSVSVLYLIPENCTDPVTRTMKRFTIITQRKVLRRFSSLSVP
jgi:hypothetical protein